MDIQAYLEDLPEGLKDAYDRVWQTIQKRRGRAKIIARRAFQWLMCSWRPLSPDGLMYAVCQDPELDFCPNIDITIEYILDACHNLIKIEGDPKYWSSTIVRFSHLSVQEYFQTHHWSVVEAHSVVGSVCLRLWMSSLHISKSLKTDVAFWPEEKRFLDLNGPDCIERIEDRLMERAKIEAIEANKNPEALKHFEISILLNGTAVHPRPGLAWMIKYASGWFFHYRILTSEQPGELAFNQALRSFLGTAGKSSLSYRKWCRWMKRVKSDLYPGFVAGLYEDSMKLPGLLPRDDITLDHHCQPEFAPEFGCAYLGLRTILRGWIDKGNVDVNRRNALGETLLSLACRAGHTSLCRDLLEHGASANSEPETQLCPLIAAAEHGHREAAKLVLQHGANVNAGGHFDAPLMKRRVLEDIGFVKLLIENGADPNVIRENWTVEKFGKPMIQEREGQQWSPLITAAYYGCYDAVQLLLDSKADVNLRVNGPFPTALFAAARNAECHDINDKILHLLLEAGADVNVAGGSYGTPLGAAICSMYGGSDKVVGTLLEAGAHYDPWDYIGVALYDDSGEDMHEHLEAIVDSYRSKMYTEAMEDNVFEEETLGEEASDW
jgi:hypothetical protein